jgi:hypothetical protein
MAQSGSLISRNKEKANKEKARHLIRGVQEDQGNPQGSDRISITFFSLRIGAFVGSWG